HEALAYKLPVDGPEHRQQLEQAAEAYRRARELDPGEKYFSEPIQRVETSMVYARAAADMMAERERWHDRALAAGDPPAKPPARAPAGPERVVPPAARTTAWTFDRGSLA